MHLFTALLVVIVQLISRGQSYSIEVESGDTHCFIVNAAAGIPCSGSFEVITPDPEPVIVRVTGPKNKLHFESKYKGDDLGEQNLSEGSFQFDADADGDSDARPLDEPDGDALPLEDGADENDADTDAERDCEGDAEYVSLTVPERDETSDAEASADAVKEPDGEPLGVPDTLSDAHEVPLGDAEVVPQLDGEPELEPETDTVAESEAEPDADGDAVTVTVPLGEGEAEEAAA
jgi:hypothetical protein